MNPTVPLVLSVLAAAATAGGLTLALRPDDAGEQLVVAELRGQIHELQNDNRVLAERIDQLIARPVAGTAPATIERAEAAVVTPEQVAAAVEAYLSDRGEATPATTAGAGKPGFDVDRDLEQLLGTSYWENTAAWKRAFEAGRMDEVIASLQQLAEANPNDVAAQMDLANAYMAYLQMDQSKWQLSMKADEQFDKVLAIDENHWEARFTKAMSYTFWPDFLGKKKEAIAHFETLIDQQSKMPAESHHAQTYLFLGNLLSERDSQRAREVWQRGLQRHPGNSELLEKLGS